MLSTFENNARTRTKLLELTAPTRPRGAVLSLSMSLQVPARFPSHTMWHNRLYPRQSRRGNRDRYFPRQIRAAHDGWRSLGPTFRADRTSFPGISTLDWEMHGSFCHRWVCKVRNRALLFVVVGGVEPSRKHGSFVIESQMMRL